MKTIKTLLMMLVLGASLLACGSKDIAPTYTDENNDGLQREKDDF